MKLTKDVIFIQKNKVLYEVKDEEIRICNTFDLESLNNYTEISSKVYLESIINKNQNRIVFSTEKVLYLGEKIEFKYFIEDLCRNSKYFRTLIELLEVSDTVYISPIKNEELQNMERNDFTIPDEYFNVVTTNKVECKAYVPTRYRSQMQFSLEDLIDEYAGLIKKIELNEIKYVNKVIYEAISYVYTDTFDLLAFSSTNFSRKKAIYGAVGEALERFNYIRDHEIEADVRNPEFLNFMETLQNEERSYKSIECNDNIILPSSLLYLDKHTSGDLGVKSKISTGMASGKTKDNVLLAGIFEVLERDDFSLTWHYRFPVKDKKSEDVFIDDKKYVQYTYDISQGDFYTSVVVLENEKDQEVMIGSATDFIKKKSEDSALLEAVQGIKYIKYLKKLYFNELHNAPYNKVDTFKKHAVYYSINWNKREGLPFLDFNATECICQKKSNIDGEQFNIRDIINKLKEKGHNIAYHFYSGYVLDNIGEYAGKVLISDMHPLEGNHNHFVSNVEVIKTRFDRDIKQLNAVIPHPFP